MPTPSNFVPGGAVPPGLRGVPLTPAMSPGIGPDVAHPMLVEPGAAMGVAPGVAFGVGAGAGLFAVAAPHRFKSNYDEIQSKAKTRGGKVGLPDIQDWLKRKRKAVSTLLQPAAKSTPTSPAKPDAAYKADWFDSDEGKIWWDHQIFSIMLGADLKGVAPDAAAYVLDMLDRFIDCMISVPQMVFISGLLFKHFGD